MAGQPGAGFPHLTGGTPPPMVLIQHPEVPGTALSISQAQYAQLLQNQAALGGLAAQGAIPAQYYQQAAPNLHISHVAVPPPQQASIAVPHDIPDPPQGRGKGRVFQCPHCDRTFTRKHNLLSHELTHGGEKAHKCEFCDQMFARKHDRNRHQRLHNGVNPYQCQQCGASWPRSDALKRHLSSERGRSKCLMRRQQMLGPNAPPDAVVPADAQPAAAAQPVPLSVAQAPALAVSAEPTTAQLTTALATATAQQALLSQHGLLYARAGVPLPVPLVAAPGGGYEYYQMPQGGGVYYQPYGVGYFVQPQQGAQQAGGQQQQVQAVQPAAAERGEEEDKSDDGDGSDDLGSEESEVQVREPKGAEEGEKDYFATLASAAAAAAAQEKGGGGK